MATFLSAQQLYRLIQRELPTNVYPDGAASAFFSTASVYSKAQVLETVYTNLSRVYDNEFPQLTDEKVSDWEVKMFGQVQDSTLSLSDRRARILIKVRKIPSLALWEILTLVVGFLPVGTFAQVVEWGCQGSSGSGGTWTFGKSRLGVNTFLGFGRSSSLKVTNGDFCAAVRGTGWRFNVSRLGKDTVLSGQNSFQTISKAQAKAYTYEVRIFNYILPALDFTRLNLALDQEEPARSARVIRQNLNPATYGLIFPVTGVTQFSGVDCIKQDPSSTTGYSGLIHK